MKRFVVVIALVLLIAPGVMVARHGSTGIGLQIGEPTGLSGKFWLSSRNAIDVVLGWNVISDRFIIQAGYLWHFPQPVTSGDFALYVGVGALAGGGTFRPDHPNYPGESYVFLGGRVPLGLEYIFAGAPIGLYAELDPIVRLLPGVGLGIGGGIGCRFYF